MALTIDHVKDITTDFCRQYPSALALKFKIRNTQEELYGPKAADTPTISAAYHPHRRIVAIPAANLRDDEELRRTLRHEIIGHYGLNTFVADDKRKILDAIVRSRHEPTLSEIWKAVEAGYPNASPQLQAEEIFAFAAERIQPGQRFDPAPSRDALQTALDNDGSVLNLRQLFALTTLVADGLAQGTRLQLNFPSSDDALFSVEQTMSQQQALGADGADTDKSSQSAALSYHEKVAAKLVEQLKQGTAPWQRPILPGSSINAFPYNPTTGANYRGMNMIALMAAERSDPRWMTYRQALAAGGQVRKDEKSTAIQFWTFTQTRDVLDAQGKPVLDERGQKKQEDVRLSRPLVRFASVFNAEQIDGLPALQPRTVPTNTIERANQLLEATGADIRHDQVDKMFYRPSTDTIHLPRPEQFRSPGDYYATAFHEVGHWTGHASRLNRDLAHPFGSEGYAKEELVAEIGSLMISQDLNLPHDPKNHASYVGSWIRALQNDPHEIFRAASNAEKARGLIMSMNQKQEQSMEPEIAIEGEGEARQAASRQYLNVPYAEKNEAKELGAKWDRATRAWYVPTGVDANPFIRWIPTSATPSEETNREAASVQQVAPIDAGSATEGTPQSALDRISDSAAMIRALALAAGENPPLSQQLVKEDLQAYQCLPGASTDGVAALAYIGESAALDAHYASTLRVLDAAVAGAAQDAFRLGTETQTEPTAQQPSSSEAATARSYLRVPYAEREQARAAGARWDAQAKSWYVGPKADHEKLAKWDVAAQGRLESTPSPPQEFAARLAEAGAHLSGEHPLMDGATHRIAVVGDKPYERSGFYVGHLDDIRPAAYFKNNRTGEEFRWKAKGYTLTDEQRAAFLSAVTNKLEERERQALARHEQRAKELSARRTTLDEAITRDRTPYLVNKGLPTYRGVYTDKEGETLFVPLLDSRGKQWSEQYIRADGSKRLAADARKEGCFHVIDGFDRLKEAKIFVLAEGYSTAATIHESLNARVPVAVVAAVDAGNLKAVAIALREEYPTMPIVIAADDDRALQERQNKNPGRTFAVAAAEAVNGVAVFPIFDPTDSATLTDFNDLSAESALGADGLRRQLTPIVEKAAGFEEQEAKITKTRTRAIRRRAQGTDEDSPRKIRRSIA